MCRNMEKLDSVLSELDFIIDAMPDEHPDGSNMVANIVASANSIIETVETIKADEKEFIPVVRLSRTELEMLGGQDLDIEHVAEKVADVLIGNYYWDVLKQVIQEMKEQ